MLPLRACTAVPGRILRPAPPPPAHADRRRDHREDDVRRKKPNTLSPLALTTDANHHRHDRHDRPVSPLSPSSYARRKLGRIEDISKLSLQTDRVANITVSPPTPGTYLCTGVNNAICIQKRFFRATMVLRKWMLKLFY